LAVRPPEGISALNILPGTVSAVGAEEGPLAIVGLDCGGAMLVARVTKKSVQDLGLAPGRRVYAIVKSVAFERRAMGRFNEPPHTDDSADT
jgi:molybdate transport system ATP-binding protein